MKKTGKISALLCTVLLIGSFAAGCGADKTYTTDKGLSVTMSPGFIEKEQVGITYLLQTATVIFSATREDFSDLAAVGLSKNSTLADYNSVIKSANNFSITVTSVDEEDVRFDYFYYDKTVSGTDYSYMGVTLKGTKSFWLCNFACESKNMESKKDDFLKWARTIVVD